jgi:hypothetical protein
MSRHVRPWIARKFLQLCTLYLTNLASDSLARNLLSAYEAQRELEGEFRIVSQQIQLRLLRFGHRSC